MSIRLYQIKDRVGSVMSSGIIMHANDRAAMRWFGDAMADGRNIMSKHPEDYDLYQIGEQEDDGTLVGNIPIILVMTGDSWAEMTSRAEQQAKAANRELPGQLTLGDN